MISFKTKVSKMHKFTDAKQSNIYKAAGNESILVFKSRQELGKKKRRILTAVVKKYAASDS